nr:unnamed protein product [Haemonchus contortus]
MVRIFCPMFLVLASFASTFYSASAAYFKVTFNTAKDSCAQAGETNQGTLRLKRIWTNPETNILLTSKTAWSKDKLSNAGVGLDFSGMYFESPFALKIDIEELTKAGEVDRGSYTLNQCWDDKKWIANEGLYQLNVVNGKWYPVYYNPRYADFYYEYG